MVGANGADASLVPCVPGAGSQAEPVQSCGDLFVRESTGHPTKDLYRLQVCATAVSSGEVFLHAQLRVPAACPVNQQYDFLRRIVNVGNDLFDQDTGDPLLKAHVCRWCVPNRWEILRQAAERLFIWNLRSVGWRL